MSINKTVRDLFFFIAVKIHLRRLLGDKNYLKLLYYLKFCKPLNLYNPTSFTEKIQWLKLNDHNDQYTKLVDKITAKEYAVEKIGPQYVIPTLGSWDSIDTIDISDLPDRFVLKTNHGGGGCGIAICKDKQSFDWKKAKKKLTKSLRSNVYDGLVEWPYKNIKPRVFAEQYMTDSHQEGDLTDYKFFCFNGRPVYCQVIKNRSSKETIDFYDMSWRHMPFIGLNPSAMPSATLIPKPSELEEMITIAEKLSNNIPFARIDLYDINNRVYFGEITFYPASGFGFFYPEEWNEVLGSLIDIK